MTECEVINLAIYRIESYDEVTKRWYLTSFKMYNKKEALRWFKKEAGRYYPLVKKRLVEFKNGRRKIIARYDGEWLVKSKRKAEDILKSLRAMDKSSNWRIRKVRGGYVLTKK